MNCDPRAVALDWLDAYRGALIDQMVGMHSPDAVIDCACRGNIAIYHDEGIAYFWRRTFAETPVLELVDLEVNGAAMAITYLTSSGVMETLLEVGEDGLITCCSCGPVDGNDR